MAADVVTAPAPAGRHRRKRKRHGAEVVVCGAGVGGLQLTLVGQAAILASGSAFTIGVAPQVIEHLRAARVRVNELDEVVAAADDIADGYLAVIDAVLAAAVSAPPAVLVVPGSPLTDNSITRALVALCRERDLEVELHASVSPIDALVNDLGVDVTGRGLQVFSAPSLLARGIAPNPDVPLFITGLGAVADRSHLAVLGHRLSQLYPPDHPVSLVTELTGRGSLVHRTLVLAEAEELWRDMPAESSLYVNPRRHDPDPTKGRQQR